VIGLLGLHCWHRVVIVMQQAGDTAGSRQYAQQLSTTCLLKHPGPKGHPLPGALLSVWCVCEGAAEVLCTAFECWSCTVVPYNNAIYQQDDDGTLLAVSELAGPPEVPMTAQRVPISARHGAAQHGAAGTAEVIIGLYRMNGAFQPQARTHPSIHEHVRVVWSMNMKPLCCS